MKVTQVALQPSDASTAAGRPSLTPELLAASGARYSRNNEGLDAILARIDFANLDRSVDSIFRMIDYGHQSIADMVPVALFIDDVSLWLAYYVWTLCPTAGGQESSTRYLRMTPEALRAAETLGIPAARRAQWEADMAACFAAYREATALWEAVAQEDPAAARLPAALLADTSEKAARQVARMLRNFAFDRARYFLPAAAATNLMLLMSARGWVQLCQHLLSHPLPEAQALGGAIREELSLSAPRLIRHATAKPSIQQGMAQEFARLCRRAAETPPPRETAAPVPFLDVHLPPDAAPDDLRDDLRFHDNRYAWLGTSLQRTTVRFGWQAVALAEIRDLNRHRTGTKYCPLLPVGFYAAAEQLPDAHPSRSALARLAEIGHAAARRAHTRLRAGEPDYVYETLLGTQFPFEHTTAADKFLYEAELRTGTGAHYRYAQHLHDALSLWYDRFPATRGLVLEGSAEPE